VLTKEAHRISPAAADSPYKMFAMRFLVFAMRFLRQHILYFSDFFRSVVFSGFGNPDTAAGEIFFPSCG